MLKQKTHVCAVYDRSPALINCLHQLYREFTRISRSENELVLSRLVGGFFLLLLDLSLSVKF